MDISASVAIDAALTRQALALEMVKMNTDAQKGIVAILEQSVTNVPASPRGAAVDFSA